MNRHLCLCCFVSLALCACGEDAPGNLSVVLEAEDTIIDGLAAGSGAEDIADGWQVSFDRYVVAIGDIEAERVGAHSHAHDETVHVVDLTAIPAAGLPLWAINELAAGDWEFFYSVVGAGDALAPVRDPSVDQVTFDAMVAGDLTYSIAGTISNATGQSCPPASLATPGAAVPNGNTNSAGDPCYDTPSVDFVFEAEAATRYGPCEVDEIPGVTVPSGGSVTVAATIHGDHLFFNGFPEGDEGGVMRLAQWLADCDLDLDGLVTMDELALITPSDLAEIDGRFQLGGSPIIPLDTMATYIAAQLKTQGHFQGEGECPIDGVGHTH